MVQIERHKCPCAPICRDNVFTLRAEGKTWMETYTVEEAWEFFGVRANDGDIVRAEMLGRVNR